LDSEVLPWLLEENNPGVRVRALTGLCGLPDNDPQVMATRGLAAQQVGDALCLSRLDGPRCTIGPVAQASGLRIWLASCAKRRGIL